MQKIEFTTDELEVLRELVRHGLTEIDVEIFRTDAHDFKEMLKRRRDQMEHILAKLSATPVAT